MKSANINRFSFFLIFVLAVFPLSSCSSNGDDYLHFGFYRDEAEGSALRLASVMHKTAEAKEGEEELTFRVLVSYGADYLAYQEPVPSLSSYGISEVAFERLWMDQGLSLGSEYVELQRMSAAAFEKTPIFLANGEIPHANLNEENYDALFFPFTRIDTLALPARSKGKGYLAYRLHAYDGNGNTVDSLIVQDALAFSFAYENGKAQFTLIDANTLEEKEQNRELPYEGFYWPDDYIE